MGPRHLPLAPKPWNQPGLCPPGRSDGRQVPNSFRGTGPHPPPCRERLSGRPNRSKQVLQAGDLREGEHGLPRSRNLPCGAWIFRKAGTRPHSAAWGHIRCTPALPRLSTRWAAQQHSTTNKSASSALLPLAGAGCKHAETIAPAAHGHLPGPPPSEPSHV